MKKRATQGEFCLTVSLLTPDIVVASLLVCAFTTLNSVNNINFVNDF